MENSNVCLSFSVAGDDTIYFEKYGYNNGKNMYRSLNTSDAKWFVDLDDYLILAWISDTDDRGNIMGYNGIWHLAHKEDWSTNFRSVSNTFFSIVTDDELPYNVINLRKNIKKERQLMPGDKNYKYDWETDSIMKTTQSLGGSSITYWHSNRWGSSVYHPTDPRWEYREQYPLKTILTNKHPNWISFFTESQKAQNCSLCKRWSPPIGCRKVLPCHCRIRCIFNGGKCRSNRTSCYSMAIYSVLKVQLQIETQVAAQTITY